LFEAFIVGNFVDIESAPGENFILYQFNGAPASVIFIQIRFPVYHDLRKAMGMYSEQIYQFRIFKSTMQVHCVIFK